MCISYKIFKLYFSLGSISIFLQGKTEKPCPKHFNWPNDMSCISAFVFPLLWIITVFRNNEFSLSSNEKNKYFCLTHKNNIYLLEQNSWYLSFIFNMIGVSDEPGSRFPTCRLPVLPSPRKSIDSIIVKLFL